jgi:SprT protein
MGIADDRFAAMAGLGDAQRGRVIASTAGRIAEASRRYGITLLPLPVHFDLTGQGAGIYEARGRERRIRYNPWLFARFFEENLRDTVAHEVAHYVLDVRFGRRRVRPHGPEWCAVMRDFGCEPRVRHDFDLEGLPVRRQRRFLWYCECGKHSLSTVRHRRMLEKRVQYRCRVCGQSLQMAP